MKKISAILLCTVIALALMACGTENEKPFEICVIDKNIADIAVYNMDEDSRWSIHFDDSLTLYYGDWGQGYECNLFRGNDLVDTFTCVNAQNAKIIHLETGYIDFNNILEYGFVDENNNIYYGYAPTEVTIGKLSVSETADEDNNIKAGNEKDIIDDANSSLYLETTYSDGVDTIVFHGTDPTHPTAMTINGNKITFDSVVVVQNDEYYIHLGFSWTYDNMLNQGDMHYDCANRHIVLKGFAIANEYVPVEYSFLGVKYFSDGPAWGASEFVLKGADENGLPTEIIISNSGSSVYGEELDGSFSIKISEYNEAGNYILGTFVGTSHPGIKGEYVSGSGNRLMIQID